MSITPKTNRIPLQNSKERLTQHPKENLGGMSNLEKAAQNTPTSLASSKERR